MPDRVQQVGLAQAGVAVDEQRVVGLGRRLGDRDGGGVGEPVAGADDEGVEGVLRVEPGRLAPGVRRARGRSRASAVRWPTPSTDAGARLPPSTRTAPDACWPVGELLGGAGRPGRRGWGRPRPRSAGPGRAARTARSVITWRSRVSMTSLANSFGTASSAVSPTTPSSRLSRMKARCWVVTVWSRTASARDQAICCASRGGPSSRGSSRAVDVLGAPVSSVTRCPSRRCAGRLGSSRRRAGRGRPAVGIIERSSGQVPAGPAAPVRVGSGDRRHARRGRRSGLSTPSSTACVHRLPRNVPIRGPGSGKCRGRRVGKSPATRETLTTPEGPQQAVVHNRAEQFFVVPRRVDHRLPGRGVLTCDDARFRAASGPVRAPGFDPARRAPVPWTRRVRRRPLRRARTGRVPRPEATDHPDPGTLPCHA